MISAAAQPVLSSGIAKEQPMPTSFLGLFLFSTALALVATFVAVTVQAIIGRVRRLRAQPPRLR